MFHMMNEARIGVGLGAAMLGMAGYDRRARLREERPQGRPVGASGGKDPTQPQVPIIEHADVKRMLLAQKSYAKARSRSSCTARAWSTSSAPAGREPPGEAQLLLEVLTPIAKSWPSEWCLEANSLAIQVLGGYGYTRDFPVEQYWRDNRLNMIHEGTHGIQALDLLGRKVVMDGGRACSCSRARMDATIAARARSAGAGGTRRRAGRRCSTCGVDARRPGPRRSRRGARQRHRRTCRPSGIWSSPGSGSTCCGRRRGGGRRRRLMRQARAARYFFRYELPKIGAWLSRGRTAVRSHLRRSPPLEAGLDDLTAA